MDVSDYQRVFGARVQYLRKQRGLTQEQLAERIERTVDTISNIERGFSSTRLETAFAIARELGCTVSELFDVPELGQSDSERRRLIWGLIELIRPLDRQTIEAIVAQAEILVRVQERATKAEPGSS